MTLHQQATGNPARGNSANPVKKGIGVSPRSNRASASPTGRMNALPQSGQTRELKIVSTNGVRSSTVFNESSDSTDERYNITDNVYIWAVHLTPSTDEAVHPKPLHIVSRDTVRRTIATFYQTCGENTKGYTNDTFYKFPGAIYCPGGFDVDTDATDSGKVGTLTIFYSEADQGATKGR